jgi:hypothetical protein
MPLGPDIIKKLSKQYEPDAMVMLRHGRYDLAVRTDKEGNPVQLFFGRMGEDGRVKGDRYTRVFKHDESGRVIKDHWERKGRST